MNWRVWDGFTQMIAQSAYEDAMAKPVDEMSVSTIKDGGPESVSTNSAQRPSLPSIDRNIQKTISMGQTYRTYSINVYKSDTQDGILGFPIPVHDSRWGRTTNNDQLRLVGRWHVKMKYARPWIQDEVYKSMRK